VTQTTYDDKGRVTRVDRPDGSYATTTYTAIDTPASVCEGTRCTTYVYYDNAGREIEQHDPDGGVT